MQTVIAGRTAPDMGNRFKRTARTALALPMSAALALGTAGVASAQEATAPAPASILDIPLPAPPSPEDVGRWIADAQTAVQNGADMLANAASWVADPTPENANKAIGAFIGAIPDAGQRDLANKLYTDAFNALNGRQQQMAEANSAFQLSNAQFGKKSPEAMDARHNVVTIKIQMADAAVNGDEEALEVFSKEGGKEIGQASAATAGDEAYDQTVSEAKADRKEAKQELRQAQKESSASSDADSGETAEVGGNEDQRIAELEKKLEDSESRIEELKEQNSSSNNTSTRTSSGGSAGTSGAGSSGGRASTTTATSSDGSNDDDSGDLNDSGDSYADSTDAETSAPSATNASEAKPTAEAARDGDESAKKQAQADRDEAASAFVKANKKLSNGIDKYVHEQVRRDDSGGLTGAGGGNDKAFNKLADLQKEEEAKLQELKDAEQAAKDAGWSQEEIGEWSAATTNKIDGHSYDASNRDEVNSSQEYKNLRAAERLRRNGLNGDVVPIICRDGKVRGGDEWSEEEAKTYHDSKTGGSDNFKNISDEDCVNLEKMHSNGSIDAYMKRVEDQQARSN